MDFSKYIPRFIAKNLPANFQRSILENKYHIILSKQFLERMKNPRNEEDKSMRIRAYKIWEKETQKFSNIENKFVFNYSIKDYAKKFSKEYLLKNHFTIEELEERLYPQKQLEKKSSILIQKKTQPTKQDVELPQVQKKKKLTKQDIILQNFSSVEEFNTEVETEFEATYKNGSKTHQQQVYKNWKQELQNADDNNITKFYLQELLKKRELFNARKLLQKSININRNKEKERGEDLEL